MTARVFRAAEAAVVSHTAGIRTTPLVVPEHDGAGWLCGISVYPGGAAAPRHRHNCHEQIVVLEGHAEVLVGDERWQLGPHDCGWIPADLDHSYRNVGAGELRLLWFYDRRDATRTTADDGVTVPMVAAVEPSSSTGDMP